MTGRRELFISIMLVIVLTGSLTLPLAIDPMLQNYSTNTIVLSEEPLTIVFDYSHGQYRSAVESLDLLFGASLEGLGYTVVWARGGINSTILSGATGLVIGAIYELANIFLSSEIQAIQEWFDEGSKFLWVGTDSDFAGYTYINNNMSAILESVGSHVYPEPTSVEDPVSFCSASYRVAANRTSKDPLVSPMVEGVSQVLMHTPTLLYGSNSTANPGVGREPIALESDSIMNVYPLLYYSEFATIIDNDLTPPYAHDDGDIGSFACVTMETHLGAANSSIAIVSGASPYGWFQPMFTSDYYNKSLEGDIFIKQTLDYGIFLLDHSKIFSPADIDYEEGVSGNVIEWRAFDMKPKSYNISLDGLLHREGLWNSSNELISVIVDGLSFGSYNYTLQVTNEANNTLYDTVFVNVLEQLAPTINHPEDISYYVGDDGSEIIWTPSDQSLFYYALFKDDELILTHYWLPDEPTTVKLYVGDLPVGIYNYTIRVLDRAMLETIDTVLVEVLEIVTTQTTTPTTSTTTNTTSNGDFNNIDTITLIVSIGSLIVIIVVAILFFKKR